jgi:hypothetical protein
MKKTFLVTILVSTTLLFLGCQKNTTIEINSGTWSTVSTLDHTDFTGAVQTVLAALKNEDFLTLSTFVWPQGLRFSPYEYVNSGTDVVLDTKLVANAPILSRSFSWWSYDGSGEPIDLWIGQYFEKFVNDADYINAPEIFYNQSVQRGNTINNIAQTYQGKSWVEFYFSGFDAQYEGIDRKSLTLVFEQVGGQRYVIGVVHGQRTI